MPVYSNPTTFDFSMDLTVDGGNTVNLYDLSGDGSKFFMMASGKYGTSTTPTTDFSCNFFPHTYSLYKMNALKREMEELDSSFKYSSTIIVPDVSFVMHVVTPNGGTFEDCSKVRIQKSPSSNMSLLPQAGGNQNYEFSEYVFYNLFDKNGKFYHKMKVLVPNNNWAKLYTTYDSILVDARYPQYGIITGKISTDSAFVAACQAAWDGVDSYYKDGDNIRYTHICTDYDPSGAAIGTPRIFDHYSTRNHARAFNNNIMGRSPPIGTHGYPYFHSVSEISMRFPGILYFQRGKSPKTQNTSLLSYTDWFIEIGFIVAAPVNEVYWYQNWWGNWTGEGTLPFGSKWRFLGANSREQLTLNPTVLLNTFQVDAATGWKSFTQGIYSHFRFERVFPPGVEWGHTPYQTIANITIMVR